MIHAYLAGRVKPLARVKKEDSHLAWSVRGVRRGGGEKNTYSSVKIEILPKAFKTGNELHTIITKRMCPTPSRSRKTAFEIRRPGHNPALVAPLHANVQSHCAPPPLPHTTGGFGTAFDVRGVVGTEADGTGAACARALRCCDAYTWFAANRIVVIDCCEDSGSREGQC